MNFLYYFFDKSNWSFPGVLVVSGLFICFLLFLKTDGKRKLFFGIAIILVYLSLGSPLSALTDFGMHSIMMLRQFFILMLAPVFLLQSLPKNIFRSGFFGGIDFSRSTSISILFFWSVGAIAMWGGHFLNAAILSAKTGIAICGLSVAKNSWVSQISPIVLIGATLFCGFIFAFPIFHPTRSRRLPSLSSIIYLFTACLSCSLLGIYITFSASSATALEAVPQLTTLRNPLPISLRTDQEIAGLLMWIPGCIFYVLISMKILYQWYSSPFSAWEYFQPDFKEREISQSVISGRAEEI